MSARYIVGDSLAVLRSLPAASVDLVLTSPPFLALRSYLPAAHPDKAAEVGLEATPGAYIDALLDVVEECRRVLAPHGSLVFELGDTYAGSGGAGGDYAEGGMRDGQPMYRAGYLRNDREGRVPQEAPKAAQPPSRTRPDGNGKVFRGGERQADKRHRPPGADPKYAQRGEQSQGTGAGGDWPLDKSLCLIPELLRFSMAYGFNPLTGRQTERWRVRNVVRWCRPNPPVGALADKVRPATSDMLVACVGRKRYFDLDAVRTPHTEPGRTFNHQDDPNLSHGWSTTGQHQDFRQNPNGAPPLDHWWHDDVFDQDAWDIPTAPYKGAHYATWPAALLTKHILAMCPQRACTTCGEPSERITDVSYQRNRGGTTGARRNLAEPDGRQNGTGMAWKPIVDKVSLTTGWTDCGHDTWRNGVVLDPFAGTGTTLAVATGHGRDAIGIDLDERNSTLAWERVGMFLEVDDLGPGWALSSREEMA